MANWTQDYAYDHCGNKSEYIVEQRKLRLQKMESEIKIAVKDLLSKDKYPSEIRVKEKLNVSYHDSDFDKILNES